MTYKGAKRKFYWETLAMSPFVLLGKIVGKFYKLDKKYDLFFFVPNGDIGGAPRVNVDILECLKDKNKLVIFSKIPKNNQFLERFASVENTRIIDLSKYIDHKVIHFVNFFFRGVVATWVNKSENPMIFGGECLFFYKMLAHVKSSTRRIELCHLNTWLPYSIGWIDDIDRRVVSTKELQEKIEAQYQENNLPKSYYDKITFWDNAIDIPPYRESENEILEVVFVGRGAPQKRVYLIAEIAKKMHEAGDKIHFSFVGDVEKVFDVKSYPYCTFYGNVSDQNKMEQIYDQSDVLILTSAYEGLPLVVMTMMARNKVVLSTAVNGIPDYIHHKENGLLIYAKDENEIVQEAIENLRLLIQNPDLKKSLGKRNQEMAKAKFGRDVFCQRYRDLLIS